MALETSILKTIRAALGILPTITDFDPELIVAINSALMAVSQLGVGPEGGFLITGVDELWSQFVGEAENIEAIKSYILIKARLEFDPPGTSFLLASFERQLTELAWRLMVEVDPDLVPAE